MEDAVELLLARLGEASYSASATSDATALEAMGFDSSEVATTLDIIGSGDVNFAVDRLLRERRRHPRSSHMPCVALKMGPIVVDSDDGDSDKGDIGVAASSHQEPFVANRTRSRSRARVVPPEAFNVPDGGWRPGRRFRSCYQSLDPRYTNDANLRTYTVRQSPEAGKVNVCNDRNAVRTLHVARLYNFQWVG